MKRLSLCLLLCTIAMPQMLKAERRTRQQAQTVAERYVKKLGFKLSTLSAEDAQRERRTATTTKTCEDYYVFNHDNDKGFTIVSGDDRLPDIVGYSTQGTFLLDSIAPGLLWYLKMYADKVAALGTPEGDSLAAEMREYNARSVIEPRTVVGPLLSTNWGQGSPYNDQCPTYQGGFLNLETLHCAAGCTAIAAAQILNYHKNPAVLTSTIPGYYSSRKGHTIAAIPGPRTYNWDNMNNSEKAKLVYHTGVSCQMQYGESSGAYLYDMADALIEHFGMTYDEDFYYTSYSTTIAHKKIDKSIDNRQPLMISGYTTGGEGHSFVCDGRSADGKYHINWGWNGSDNGYFDITALRSYTEHVECFVGIRILQDAAQLERTTERQRLTALADSIYEEAQSQISAKLITTSSQFYSEFTDPTEGSFANLLDGDSTTFWHSTWQGGKVALGTHYFQVTLENPMEGRLNMFLARRDYNNDYDHITELGIKASNDTHSWTDITTLSLPYNNCRESFYRTFNLPKPYKYLRFYINNTYCKNMASRGYGHLGEFQLYPAFSVEKTEALETLCNTVAAQQEGLATNEQIAAIRQAFRNYFGVGNVNTDEHINISDAMTIVRIIQQQIKDKYGTADVNADRLTNDSDVDTLIHILLNN